MKRSLSSVGAAWLSLRSAVAAILIGQVAWFWLLHPLRPNGALGWLVACLLGLAVTVLTTGSIIAMDRLKKSPSRRALSRTGAIAISVSLSVGLYVLVRYLDHWMRFFSFAGN